MITKLGHIIHINSFNLNGDLMVEIKEKVKSFHFVIAGLIDEESTSNVLKTKINNPTIWTLDNPYLYKYSLDIKYENEEEHVEGKFAFRTLGQNGKNLTLNGTPIFVRGYIRGATAHEHSNNINSSEEEFYRKNIKEAKKFGFNMVRFHSVVPNETYFKVADEEGILVHIELRMPNDNYNNLEEMLYSKKELIPDSFILKVIDSYYEHPSLTTYCIGNEIKGLDTDERCDQIGRLIKTTDPSRLYLDTCAWGKFGRPHVDMDVQHLSYFFPYATHDSMYSDARTIHTLKDIADQLKPGESPFKVPLIAHEVCHYTALRDFASLKEKFNSYSIKAPWWIDEELKLIHEKGFDDEYQEMYKASKKFQFECWKTAYEAMRKSPLLGGFHFLQFADTDVYENSNGLVDCFDDENAVNPKDFLKFNGDITILCDFPKRNFYLGDKVKTTIHISNYGETILTKSSLVYKLFLDEKVIKEETIKYSNSIGFGLTTIQDLELDIPNLDSSKGFTLSVSLYEDNKEVTNNSWNFWCYKNNKKYSYNEFVNYEKDNVVITDNIDKAFSSLKEGKKVCLVYRSDWTRHLLDKNMPNPTYAFRATWNRFKPVIWDRGTNFGGTCDDKLLNKYGFASNRFYDFNYSVITEDCDKIILDDFPVKVNSLVTGIDKCNRDRFDAYKVSFNLPELMPDRTLRHFSYVFEIKVNESSLLVCGLNLLGLDVNEPSTVGMSEFILNYMHSNDFSPANSISLEELVNYMKKSAEKPVKERMMTQYWELDDAPVESKQYWEDSRAYLTEK